MELKPTYGNFQVTGTIHDFIKNKEGQVVSTGVASNGEPYKSLRMSVQTTENNILVVELFGMTKNAIRASKKEGTGKDAKYVNKEFPWDKRDNLPKDWALSGFEAVTFTSDKEKQSKNTNEVRVAFDAVDRIEELYKPGDAVFIRGSLGYNVFNNETRLRCNIQRILRADETKFDKEGNEPCAKFEQTIVIRDTRLEKNEKRLYIDGLVILDKNGNFAEKEFYVDITEREALAKNIKKLKPFTQIKITGDIINEALISEVEEVAEDDGWGSDAVMQRKVVTGFANSLRVTMADPSSLIESMYKETDFISKDIIDEEEDEVDDDLLDAVSDEEEDEIFDNSDEDDLGQLATIEETDDEDEWI